MRLLASLDSLKVAQSEAPFHFGDDRAFNHFT